MHCVQLSLPNARDHGVSRKIRMKHLKTVSTAASLRLMGSLTLSASHALTFIGTSGSLAASVEFVQSGSNLQVRLTNTSSTDVLVPTDVLTGVYFDIKN